MAKPLTVTDATPLQPSMIAMLAALAAVLVLAAPRRRLVRAHGIALLVAYPAFVALALVS